MELVFIQLFLRLCLPFQPIQRISSVFFQIKMKSGQFPYDSQLNQQNVRNANLQ